MAISTETIRRITIEARQTGLPETTTSLNDLTAAHGKLATASEATSTVTDTSSKRQLSAANAYNQQTRNVVDGARAQENIAKAVKIATAAFNEGLLGDVKSAEAKANLAQRLTLINEKYGQATFGSKALTAATSGVSGQLIALSAGAGPVGVFLAALGPWGLAAAVGLGLAAAAIGHMREEANRLGGEAIGLRTFADTANFTIDEVRALNKLANDFGISTETTGRSIQHFSGLLDEARRGQGALFDAMRRVDGGLALELTTTKTGAQSWDVFARALAKATDEEQRNALGRAGLGGRGALPLVLVAGATNAAGGIDQMAAGMAKFSGLTEEATRHLAETKVKIDDAKKHMDDLVAAQTAQKILDFELAVLRVQERITMAVLNTKVAINEVTAAEDARAAAAARVLKKYPGATKVDNFVQPGMTPTNDNSPLNNLYDTYLKIKPAVDAYVEARNREATVVKESLNAAILDANLMKERVGLLGPAATVDEHRIARLKELHAAFLENKFDLKDAANNEGLYNRAVSATNIDARVQKDALRIGQLGELATVVDLNKQKEDALQKSIREGAQFSPEELAAIRERNKLLTENSKIENQMVFDRSQIFKSQTDQSVDALLRAQGIPPASDRAKVIRDYMQMNDVLKEVNSAGGQFVSGALQDMAHGVGPVEALANASKRLADNLINAAGQKLASLALGSLANAAGLGPETIGATSSAAILTTAATTMGTTWVTAATEVANILFGGGTAAAAPLPVAGAETGVELEAGGLAAGTLISGPFIIILAAITPAIGVASSLFPKKAKPQSTAANNNDQAKDVEHERDQYHRAA